MREKLPHPYGWIVHTIFNDLVGERRIVVLPQLRHAMIRQRHMKLCWKLSRGELFMIGWRAMWAAIRWRNF